MKNGIDRNGTIWNNGEAVGEMRNGTPHYWFTDLVTSPYEKVRRAEATPTSETTTDRRTGRVTRKDRW